ncbi:MAG: MATE family efflux transporter [Hungatella hathewayi]|nr:MATE family efflux transporter [Hungatella hathewayi]
MNQTDKNQANQFMKTRPVFGLLMSMSVPMIISMLIQSLYNIVDSIYVSRLGTQALTAVSLAFPLQNISTSVAIGMGVGITSAISIHLGAGSAEKANRSATIGVALAAVHCLIFVVFGLLATRPFLMLFTRDEQTLTWACQYTYIVVCVSFGCQLQLAMEKIFQAVGSMKVTMVLLAAGCIINIILDPILIFGLLGFPALGIIGAAVATVIGQIAAFLLYIVVYHRKRKTFPVKIHPQYLHFDKAIIRQIYSVGIPSTIMLVLPSVLVSILNSLLARFSDVYVAVLGVYFKLQTFIYMPASGIVQGMRPIIGYNYGAGEYDRVKKVIRYSLLSAAVIMAVGTVAALGFPAQIFAMFDAEEALLDAGISALRIISLGFVISTVGVICSGTFEALGRGKDSLIVSLLRQFVITIPLSFLLSGLMGADGVWLAFPISELCASVVAWILFRRVPNLG